MGDVAACLEQLVLQVDQRTKREEFASTTIIVLPNNGIAAIYLSGSTSLNDSPFSASSNLFHQRFNETAEHKSAKQASLAIAAQHVGYDNNCALIKGLTSEVKDMSGTVIRKPFFSKHEHLEARDNVNCLVHYSLSASSNAHTLLDKLSEEGKVPTPLLREGRKILTQM